MRADKTKIVYIAGSGRSGSTFLDGVLGQAPGFFPGGELRNIWSWGTRHTARCGCGEPFHSCDFWQQVFAQACGGFDRFASGAAYPRGYPDLRRKDIPKLLLHPRDRSFDELMAVHAESLRALYTSIARVSHSRAIVDSSKRFEYAYALATIPSFDVYVVHLVRDSRAYAASELKWAARYAGAAYAQPRKLLAARAAAWVGNQVLSELLRSRPVRYRLMRYEDFASDPRGALGQIAEFIGEDLSGLPWVDDRSLEFSPKHSALGNPVRFHQGKIDIRLDADWRERMEPGHRALVTALTWPLLWRYGYLSATSTDQPSHIGRQVAAGPAASGT
ncbi:MAG TPA: sulfotransferase [Chloroflexota bacterium]|nr:sulfotransferase [Chloroflexota bacterium]